MSNSAEVEARRCPVFHWNFNNSTLITPSIAQRFGANRELRTGRTRSDVPILRTLEGFPPIREYDFKIATEKGGLDSAGNDEPAVAALQARKAARAGTDNRFFVDAVLWLVRARAPWCDLPKEFGR
jgi:hypothetical protein